MPRIYKYALQPPKEGTAVALHLPVGARLLSVEAIRDTIVAYAAVVPEEKNFVKWLFHVIPTGIEFSVGVLLFATFLGTVKLEGDTLVFHVFCENIRPMDPFSGYYRT